MNSLWIEPMSRNPFRDKYQEEIEVRVKEIIAKGKLYFAEMDLYKTGEISYEEIYEIAEDYVVDQLADELQERRYEESIDLEELYG